MGNMDSTVFSEIIPEEIDSFCCIQECIIKGSKQVWDPLRLPIIFKV